MRIVAISVLCLSLSQSVLAQPAAPITPLQQLTDLRLSIRSDRRVMAFDIVNWLNSNDRAARFRALHP